MEEHLDYLDELGVPYLHLMPLLRPREGDNDGGYAVRRLPRGATRGSATIDDLAHLAGRLRGRGISTCIDLVLNHTAREHEWAAAARPPATPSTRDYYRIFPDRTLPDRLRADAARGVPRLRARQLHQLPDGRWVWTTFNDWQWDLNWANPRVFVEFADILLEPPTSASRCFRLDAIAFLWKRMGTNCQNQPEVHDLTQALRACARIAAPGGHVQGRGDRRPGRPRAVPRRRPAPRAASATSPTTTA